MDCGPVSLQMIAKYYGKDFSLDKLRNLTFTVKNGVSLFAIIILFSTNNLFAQKDNLKTKRI